MICTGPASVFVHGILHIGVCLHSGHIILFSQVLTAKQGGRPPSQKSPLRLYSGTVNI